MNSPQRSQEAQEATPRWIEVLAPSFKIQAPSRPSGDVQPRWLKWTKEHQAVKEL
jgi:hypothetical protein